MLYLTGIEFIILVLCYAFFIAVIECFRVGENLITSAETSSVLRRVVEKSEYYITVCYAGSVLVLISCGVLLAWCFFKLQATNYSPYAVVLPLALVVYILIMLAMQVVRAIVRKHNGIALKYLAYPLLLIGWFSFPIAFVVKSFQSAALSILSLPIPQLRMKTASSEEISALVERSSEEGKIEEEQGEMLQGVIDFADSVVREVMTPRKDIVFVREGASLREILTLFKKEQLSRLLVIGETLDDVKGILIIKDLLPLLTEPKGVFSMQKYIRPAFTVSETMKNDELLEEFRKNATHFAVVLDEHGGVAGVVTVEDLVEEIVGEIFDEFDVPEEEQETKVLSDGSLEVDGGTLIDDLNTEYDLGFPVGEYDTVAGLVINILGKIPVVGEHVECNGFMIEVTEMQAHRIISLKITEVD